MRERSSDTGPVRTGMTEALRAEGPAAVRALLLGALCLPALPLLAASAPAAAAGPGLAPSPPSSPVPVSRPDTLRGRVVSADDRTPVPEAWIEVETPTRTRLARADSLGRFELTDVDPGSRTVVVSAEGFERRTLEVSVPAEGAADVVVGLTPRSEPARRPEARITGRVTAGETGRPVEGVHLQVEGTRVWALTDSLGRYALRGVPEGPQTVRLSRIGFASSRIRLQVPEAGMVVRDVELAERALESEELVVTVEPADRAEGELGTASVIDREALEHVNAASVGEALELVPGIELSQPGLDDIQQVSLRAAPTSGSNARNRGAGAPLTEAMTSFGTTVILDGVPVSNNANLQTLGPRGAWWASRRRRGAGWTCGGCRRRRWSGSR